MAQYDQDIARLFEPGAESALNAYMRLLHPADIAELFNYVQTDSWPRITALLKAEDLAEVIADLDTEQRNLLATMLKTERLIKAVDELETDDAADVIADLPDEKSMLVLNALEDQQDVRKLLEYDQDSAGGLMQTELCRVQQGSTVLDAIDAVRTTRDLVDDVLEVYVVNAKGLLTGVVALEDLVLSKESVSIDSISIPCEHKITPEVDQEEVANMFGKYDLVTLPVTDSNGVLLGRITFDDIHDVIEEEASEDIMTMAGAANEDLVYSGSTTRIAFLRLPWLASSLVGSLLTGYLLSLFSHIPGNAIIMASFVPVVMAMTGNLGSQTAMIVTRGFAIGKIDIRNMSKTFVRELSVGFIMSISAGISVGLFAQLWQGEPMLGIAISTAMICSMTLASFVGVAAPALFKRVGIDPAIAAGPLVTTGCDLLGVLIYLLVAIAFLT